MKPTQKDTHTSEIARMATDRLSAITEEIGTLTQQLNELQTEEKGLRAMVDAYRKSTPTAAHSPTVKKAAHPTKNITPKIQGKYSSLGKFTLELVKSEDRPLLTSEVTKAYSELRGKKFDKDSIGSSLSGQYKIGEMQSIQINEMPNGLRNWIIVKKWLNGDGTLKQDYMNKIRSRLTT